MVERRVRIQDRDPESRELQLVLQHYRGLGGLAGDDDNLPAFLHRADERAGYEGIPHTRGEARRGCGGTGTYEKVVIYERTRGDGSEEVGIVEDAVRHLPHLRHGIPCLLGYDPAGHVRHHQELLPRELLEEPYPVYRSRRTGNRHDRPHPIISGARFRGSGAPPSGS